ncbi:MAG: hypothetical protein FJ388_21540 [Verrucomicrobia bacterium]|nr:hypothetical protein [Verrucomicrobiota bacterium]
MRTELSRRQFLQETVALAAALPFGARGSFAGEKPSVAGLRVFVMGHSFHMFIAQPLSSLAAAGIRGHELVGRQSIGGSRVIQHWNLPDEKNLAKTALREGKVDVLTMSPNWIVPDEGIERFVELGLQHNPQLRVIVQESWMPWDGWLPEEKVPNNEARDTRSLDIVRAANARWKGQLEPQIRALNQKLGREVIHVAPVGDAVLKLRELILAGKAPGIAKQSELFTDQIGHGKPPVQALAAYCVFACIYRVSPVGLNDPQPGLDRLSPDLKLLLQRIAWETVTAHPMSGVTTTAARNRRSR